MITHLVEGLAEGMPEGTRRILDTYRDQVAASSSEPAAEWHRAFLCARWADRVVSLPEHHHLAQEAARSAEAVRLLGEAVSTELGRLVPEAGWRVSAGFAAEIAWVYEAIRVAQKVAAATSWDAVPWESLLQELLRVPVEAAPGA